MASAFRFPQKKWATAGCFDCATNATTLGRRTTNPSLEDWLELLDNVRRRIARKKVPFDEEARLTATIRERYPEATL